MLSIYLSIHLSPRPLHGAACTTPRVPGTVSSSAPLYSSGDSADVPEPSSHRPGWPVCDPLLILLLLLLMSRGETLSPPPSLSTGVSLTQLRCTFRTVHLIRFLPVAMPPQLQKNCHQAVVCLLSHLH